MEKSINICSKAAKLSTEFEQSNTELKRIYLIKYILLYNKIVSNLNGYKGSFGTGYPFYALKPNLTGELPLVEEQIRYNNELINHVIESNYTTWNCAQCLKENENIMPDLKQICKPCPNMDNELKPRKILNRLPDIDLWTICTKDNINTIQEELKDVFYQNNMHPSDIDPIQTINDLEEIVKSIKNDNMPEKLLPLDAHIIDYQTLLSLIEQVPYELKKAKAKNQKPYLPIHPLSLRKTWQYDDTAYNFIHDYLSSFTAFNFNREMIILLQKTRTTLVNTYSPEELYQFLIESGPESVLRRHRTIELKDRFKERVESWKR